MESVGLKVEDVTGQEKAEEISIPVTPDDGKRTIYTSVLSYMCSGTPSDDIAVRDTPPPGPSLSPAGTMQGLRRPRYTEGHLSCVSAGRVRSSTRDSARSPSDAGRAPGSPPSRCYGNAGRRTCRGTRSSDSAACSLQRGGGT